MKERSITWEYRVAEGIKVSETKTGLAGEFRRLGGSVATMTLGAAQEPHVMNYSKKRGENGGE